VAMPAMSATRIAQAAAFVRRRSPRTATNTSDPPSRLRQPGGVRREERQNPVPA
jgi:hypothetical protein